MNDALVRVETSVRDGVVVARVLEIVEFDRAAPVHSDLDQALAGVGGEA